MKFFGILLLVCASVLYARSQELSKEKFIEIAKACKEETGATDADIEAILNHQKAGTSAAKCMNACVMKKFGLMTADGKLDKDTAMAAVKLLAKGDEEKEKIGAEVVESCHGIAVDDDHCEASQQYISCIHEHAHEKGISLDL